MIEHSGLFADLKRVLPMFHAAGWTFPWANVFAFATQVSFSLLPLILYLLIHHFFMQITLRSVNYTHIWNHLLHSGVTHYGAAPTVQVRANLSIMICIFP